MGTEFFDELSETITRTAKGLGERAEQIYETQKIRNKIAGEDRIIDKMMVDLGNVIYKRYVNGQELDEEQIALCREIEQHKEQIARYKEELADKKGRKICPACQEAVDREVSFCPFCGAPVPTPEPETEAADPEEETTDPEETAQTEEVEESEQPAEEKVSGTETEKAGEADGSDSNEPVQASDEDQNSDTPQEQAVES